MAPNSPLESYATQRAQYYDQLSPSQLKVHAELQQYIDNKRITFEAKKDQITGEINEYERHFAGYFALAISFIISGLLSNQIPHISQHITRASRAFLLVTVTTALLAALLLFLEYILTYRLFNRWQKNIKQALKYIDSSEWKTPQALEAWLAKHQQEVKEKSTHLIQHIEMGLIGFAFLFLVCWLTEMLFNPNWPIWN